MTTIKLDVTVRGHTHLAILCATADGENWIPLSQIVDQKEEPGLGGPEITQIEIPEWLAISKGLLRKVRDENTNDLFGQQP